MDTQQETVIIDHTEQGSDLATEKAFADIPVTAENVAPLGNVAMIAKFKTTSIGTQKKDKEATTIANNNFGVDSEAGFYSKAKISKEYISPIRNIMAEARKQHQRLTLPWGDDGERLLPNKNFKKHAEMIMYAKSNLTSAAIDLENKWTQVIADAKNRLGSLYNESEYPEQHEVSDLFTIETEVHPIPTGDQFTMNELVDTEKNLLVAKLEDANAKREIQAKKDTWYRLYDVIATMSKKLNDPNAKRFHKTLVSNIEGVLDLLPGLNIGNDKELDIMMESVRETLCDYDPHSFKDEEIKKEAAERTDDILERMRTYMSCDNSQEPDEKSDQEQNDQ